MIGEKYFLCAPIFRDSKKPLPEKKHGLEDIKKISAMVVGTQTQTYHWIHIIPSNIYDFHVDMAKVMPSFDRKGRTEKSLASIIALQCGKYRPNLYTISSNAPRFGFMSKTCRTERK